MIKLKVNGKTLLVPKGSTVMQACEQAGEEIPRFCYHDRLSIAGNCRMCLVEVEKSPKPVASCAMPAAEDMVINTNTERVKKARKGVMEFLLINHPLDCPICDQGGECDLQDQSIYYGKSVSRYLDKKRAVPEKNFGPLVKTVMTRCIHCTRCVRFMDEVAGTHDLGAINRGENMEITSSLKNGISNELSGNIIDLCPVGALTSKPYAFTARSWELKHFDSIDVLDAVCSNIRIDEFAGEVKRIVPRTNEAINQEWISDKARFSYDGLSNQRLDKPFIRKNNNLEPSSWEEALSVLSSKIKTLKSYEVAAVSGKLTDVETLYSAKLLFDKLNMHHYDCRYNFSQVPTKNRSDWLFNASIEGIDKADKLLIIGCDPKREVPIINARIRERWLSGFLDIRMLCVPDDLPYEGIHHGNDISLISQKTFLDTLQSFFSNSKNPIIILGDTIIKSNQGKLIHSQVKYLANKLNVIREDWNGFCFLNTDASRVGGLDIGFFPKKDGYCANKIKSRLSKEIKLLFLIEADDFVFDTSNSSDLTIVYIGHHGDIAAPLSDIILPSSAYTEKKALYINLEGRPQYTKKVTERLGQAVDGWKIFRALADKLNVKMDYNSHEQLLNKIFEKYPHISKIDKIFNNYTSEKSTQPKEVKKQEINCELKNFYQTCSISRSSENMANCVRDFIQNKKI